MRTVWLASYPKSGNTWLRLLLGALLTDDASALDINAPLTPGGIASDREIFDHMTLLDSGVLSFAEIDALRPRIHQSLATNYPVEETTEGDPAAVRYIKTHDAYMQTSRNEPLLGGIAAADGAVLIVRDPRDIASSLAHHNGSTVDEAVSFLCDPRASFAAQSDRQPTQLRQRLGSWSDFNTSWLDQTDLPILLLSYEALLADTVAELEKLLDFVGVSVSAVRRAAAAELSRFERIQAQEHRHGFREASRAKSAPGFFRRGESGHWRNELDAAQVAQIERAHAVTMRRLNYQPARAVDGGDAR